MAHTIGDMATTEATARELRADAQRNRERIIAAAIEVFAERGLEASTAEIAQRAGVGEATLFRRFPSKDDLIQAIVETQMEVVIEIATDCLTDPDPGAGLERFLTEMVERSVADRGVMESAKDALHDLGGARGAAAPDPQPDDLAGQARPGRGRGPLGSRRARTSAC